MIPLAPAGIPIGIHPGTDGQLREKNRLKSFFGFESSQHNKRVKEGVWQGHMII